ncbi:efflux transporter outer membrane subunit [Azoarcus sp. KH32C]|uniref:efflux transporter outer membrane subunit n=1 Tax=Azoarcus sp. KH32C TaxID=748247 RepID=UPI0002386C47|nr:efflux transporter outer membrane subunit [Azoarcus sp. KH32C]BAL23843.1 RND efflux system, outer membrane lipoprotein, NodT family [Azoarcus sp. KH32C]
MSVRPLLLATLSAAVLTACASFEGLAPRAAVSDANHLAASTSLAGDADKTAAWPSNNWWSAFGDAQLDRLMDEALATSPSLRIARARLDRANAVAGLADAARVPQITANATSTNQRFSENGQVPPPLAGSTKTSNRAALDFSYELDFWGKNAAAFESAVGNVRAAEAETQQARLLLSSALARSYIQLQREFEQQDIAEALLQQRRQLQDLTDRRVRAGLDTAVEFQQASAAIPATEAELAAIHERMALLRNQIAALLGSGPDRGLAIERPTVDIAHTLALPSVLPAELIGRRPDVVAQRWRVEAAAKDIDVVKAQFYPNVNLVAFVGFQSIGLGHFLDAGSRIAGAGPAISLPIFDGGRLRSQLAARDADYDAAAEQYNATLVDALHDVADQVASWRAIDTQLEQSRAALGRLDEAYRLALLRYREGLSTYLTVLSVEAQVLGQRRQVADLEARRRDTAVGLARALGGGFEPGTSPATVQITRTPAAA